MELSLSQTLLTDILAYLSPTEADDELQFNREG
jgi:hypothetical protein